MYSEFSYSKPATKAVTNLEYVHSDKLPAAHLDTTVPLFFYNMTLEQEKEHSKDND